MNNISQHFVTAWLGLYLKGDEENGRLSRPHPQLPMTVSGPRKTTAPSKPEHTHWHGFQNRTAKGLQIRSAEGGRIGLSLLAP
jgi:hypothetical protein